MQTKAILSTLWIFVLLNVIFRDIHELFRPGVLQEMMTGTVNGLEMTQPLLLIAGIGLELGIIMIPLCRVLPYRLNRWANIIIAPLMLLSLIGNGVNDLDDMWFLAIESIALMVIVWMAWRWTDDQQESRSSLILESVPQQM